MAKPTFFVYGLQRSGTNFLTEFARCRLNIKLKNNDCGDRQSVIQKHFRIYDDKSVIPVKQYHNNTIVEDYEMLEK